MKELRTIVTVALLLACGACRRQPASTPSAEDMTLDELKAHLERTAVPDTRTPEEKMSELNGVIAEQTERVREARDRLSGAQTEHEIENAQEDVLIQEHILSSLKARVAKESVTKSTTSPEAAPSAPPAER